jgi:hypothetical protein
LKTISETSGYRVRDIEPELASRLFWGAYSFAVRRGVSFTAYECSSAQFIPRPEGELPQWVEKLSGEWDLIPPRLMELVESHQVPDNLNEDIPPIVFTTLKCRVCDSKKLIDFLLNRSPEIVGGQDEEDGSVHFDWTGPVPSADDLAPDPSVSAQRLLAQATLRDDILTVESRTAAWTARFYELIARHLPDAVTLENVEWKSFGDMLPP